PLQVLDPGEARKVVHEPGEALFALPQRFLDPPALGHVLGDIRTTATAPGQPVDAVDDGRHPAGAARRLVRVLEPHGLPGALALPVTPDPLPKVVLWNAHLAGPAAGEALRV